MKSDIVKNSFEKFTRVLSFKYPALGWYFDDQKIDDAFAFQKKRWVCMFMYMNIAMKKSRPIRFSDGYQNACVGPAEYFGFRELTGCDGSFIADKERFKKTRALARNYHLESMNKIHPPVQKFLYMQRLETIGHDKQIEVVNLFPDPASLASLSVLSSYDRMANSDNVIMPFASGCQSVFTIPRDEGQKTMPRSVIGLMDPLVRQFIPEDMLAFSLPANRFVEMANNIKGSFLDKIL